MASPLPANRQTGDQFTAAEEDQVEAAVNTDSAILVDLDAVNGVVKGNGAGLFSAAQGGVDYQSPATKLVVTTAITLPNVPGHNVYAIVKPGGSVTVPTAINNYNTYFIANATGAVLAVPTTSSQPINGSALPPTLNDGDAITLSSDLTTGWYVF